MLFLLVYAVLAGLVVPASAWGERSCNQDPSLQALIQRGRDTHRSYEERKRDYQQALRLCRQSSLAYDGLSVLLLEHQDFDSALQWTQSGLKVVPEDAVLTADLAMVELSMGRPLEALQTLTKLESTARVEFYRGLANRALRDDRAAQQSFAKAFEMGYPDPYVLYALIEQDHVLGERQDGLEHFKIFSERYPNSPWLHVLLGNAYVVHQDVANAEGEYQQSLQIDAGLPIVHYALGRLAFDRGDYSSAGEDFRKEIALDPTFGEAYLYLGETLRREGKSADALAFLEKAAARDPNSALTYTQLAATQIQLKKLPEALQTLQVAKERFPTEASFPAQLSTLLYRLGREPEAKQESALAELLSKRGNSKSPDAADTTAIGMDRSALFSSSTNEELMDPQLKPLRNCLVRADKQCAMEALSRLSDPKLKEEPEYLDLSAQVMTLEGKTTEALAAIDQAIKLEPKRATYLITEGKIYQSSHDQVHAIRSFLLAAQLQPGWVEPPYFLGMSFFLLGNEDNDTQYYDRGSRHFRVALELDPNFHKAEFMLGIVDAVENHLDKAKEHFEHALQMTPQNPYYLLHYGILLKQMGDRNGALREMEMAETLDHANPLTYFNLGLLESQLEKYAEARQQLETAVRLDSNLASAYYCLGGVYHHLGLAELSQAAYVRFQQARASEQKDEADPLEAAFSSKDLHASVPK